jgi:hypothetical protein
MQRLGEMDVHLLPGLHRARLSHPQMSAMGRKRTLTTKPSNR